LEKKENDPKDRFVREFKELLEDGKKAGLVVLLAAL